MAKGIKFKFNKQKAIEAILYLANKRPSIDKMSLFKFLFFADIEHLNKYARPIFGGYYVAMPFGPVPSQVCDLLKRNEQKDFLIDGYMVTAARKANLDYLSKTDKEVLDQVYGKLGNYNARELSELSHEHISWKNARAFRSWLNNNKIKFEDMIEPSNKELIEDLVENSQYILI